MADRTRTESDSCARADADDTTHADGEDPASEGSVGNALAGADDPPVVWALASFHTATLTAVLVVGLYVAGPLGDLLAGLQTVIGLGLYLALWASTWWTTRKALRTLADSDTDVSASVFVGTGGKWAGVNGALFLWVLLVVTVIPVANVSLEGVAYFLVFGGVGSLLAFAVGAIVGVLFAVLDLVLLRAAVRIVPESSD